MTTGMHLAQVGRLVLCGIFLLLLRAEAVLAQIRFPIESTGTEYVDRDTDQGRWLLQRGAFDQAIDYYRERVQHHAGKSERDKQIVALTQLAQAYRGLGQYRQALQHLEVALELAEQVGHPGHMASVLGRIGSIYAIIGPADRAVTCLNRSVEISREAKQTALTAGLLNNLGSLFSLQRQYEKAQAAYGESLVLALGMHRPALAAKALTNTAMAALHNGQHQDAKRGLDTALEQTRGLPHTHDKAYGLLSIGLAYRELRTRLPDGQSDLLRLAAETFQEAADIAGELEDTRVLSYAWGYLGTLYEEERRYAEALQLTRRAVFFAQQKNVTESLYRWQWQSARLLTALQEPDAALAAYRGAVDTLQSLRHELSRGSSSRPSFQEEIRPVYFGLVDLLLKRAAALPERVQYQPYLRQARDTVEAFKVAEFQDYFLDDCVEDMQAKAVELDVVSTDAAIIYPILLEDRTELLVSLPHGMERFQVPVGLKELTQVIRKFRTGLERRTTWQFRPHAQTLYNWLIRPLLPAVPRDVIRTLVFVPDGPLRTIPMAALFDGRDFLIHHYALATTPGLALTAPEPLVRDRASVLAVGLTEGVQGFSPLPYVSKELQAIQTLYDGTVLLDQAFHMSNMKDVLQRQQFSIMHVASHGQFDSEVENTFLLAFGEKLTMDELDALVGSFWPSDAPLELLTLSACETAVGDDRAALGLAGVAIKAGARSALATLWHVNDQASSELVVEFYRQLQNPAVSRAKALQQAQLSLIREPRYAHPGYWAPFLMLNNWL